MLIKKKTCIKSNSKPFYNIIKPLTNKGALCCTDISLIEDETIITNDMTLQTYLLIITQISLSTLPDPHQKIYHNCHHHVQVLT